jgi:hypothetical protein
VSAVDVAPPEPPGWERVLAAQAHVGFVEPDVDARVALGDLVARMSRACARGVLPRRLVSDARALQLSVVEEDGVVWLSDGPDAVRGTGLLALRLGDLPEALILQAPHPFDDARTGEIALLMFDAASIRGVMVATAERDLHPGSDPAHAEESTFNAMTLALAESLRDPLFVQLHGFAATTSEADAIVSPGAARWPGDFTSVVDALSIGLSVVDVRSGADVPKLAGRTNVQGRILADEASFLHLELSRPVREGLYADPSRAAALADALIGVAEAR